MTKAELEKLFKNLKTEVKKINGVSGCGGNLSFPERKIIVYLTLNTDEVRDAVEKVVEGMVGNRLRRYEIEWEHTGHIDAADL